MYSNEIGPFFKIPHVSVINKWIGMGVRNRINGRNITRRETQLFSAIRSIALANSQNDFKQDIVPDQRMISTTDIIHALAGSVIDKTDKSFNPYQQHVRQVTLSLHKLSVMSRTRLQIKSNGRGTFLYTLEDPDLVVTELEAQLDGLVGETIPSILDRNKKALIAAKANYNKRENINLVKNVNNDEPWSTTLMSYFLDLCCRESIKDTRPTITRTLPLQNEMVEITSVAPAGGLMTKTDIKYLMALISLNMQSHLDGLVTTDKAHNRYAIDIQDILEMMKTSDGGKSRSTVWNAINRIRQTTWTVKLDPKGELAKQLAADSKGPVTDTVYINFLNDFMSGLDPELLGDDNAQNKVPRYIEYSLGKIVFDGMLGGSQGLVVHPGIMMERNNHIVSIYTWLRRTLPPGGRVKLTAKELYVTLDINTSYSNFVNSVMPAILKKAGRTIKDVEVGQTIIFNMLGYQGTCYIEEPQTKSGNAKKTYSLAWHAPVDMLAIKLTDLRNNQLREASIIPAIAGQGRLFENCEE